MAERLQKVLAQAGFGSRRACEELISSGRVRVNGRAATLGIRVEDATDVVEVDGLRVSFDRPSVYYLLHKPVGTVTTARDPQGRPTVVDLVPLRPRVFPVGRLDRDTSGLLLMTNDGEFALRMTHPRYGVAKTYVAEVTGEAGRRQLSALRAGVRLDDGTARAAKVGVKAASAGRSIVEIEVLEGRKRMVRRMLDAVGLPVRSLARTSFGPLSLGRLQPGAYRDLHRDEVLALLAAADRGAAESSRPGAAGRSRSGGAARTRRRRTVD